MAKGRLQPPIIEAPSLLPPDTIEASSLLPRNILTPKLYQPQKEKQMSDPKEATELERAKEYLETPESKQKSPQTSPQTSTLKPPKKTREEVEALKRSWVSDDCWQLSETEGFEDYKEELIGFEKNMEKVWAEKREAQQVERLSAIYNLEKAVTFAHDPGEDSAQKSMAYSLIALAIAQHESFRVLNEISDKLQEINASIQYTQVA